MVNIELGTKFKLNIHLAPIDGMTLDSYDYTTEVFCTPERSIVAAKSDTIRVDEENYLVRVDTNVTGVGVLQALRHISLV